MRYADLSSEVPRQAVKMLDGLGSSAAPVSNAGRQVSDKGPYWILNYSELLWRRRESNPGPEVLCSCHYVRVRRFGFRREVGPPAGRPCA